MTEVVHIIDRRARYIPKPLDKRALRRQGEVEGELGVDILLRRLNWKVSNLETGYGGEILTVMPRHGPTQPFLQFRPADKQKGEISSRVRFDSGASGVEVSLNKSFGVSVQRGGRAVKIDNGLVGESPTTLSLDRSGVISFVIPAGDKHSNALLLEEGDSSEHTSLIYSLGKAGQLVINNVDPNMIKKDFEGMYVQAMNEYGNVIGTFGTDGSAVVVLFPRGQK